jgi:hypothetical protein
LSTKNWHDKSAFKYPTISSTIISFDLCPIGAAVTDVPADAGFLRDKAAVLGAAIKEALLQIGLHIAFTHGLCNDGFKC